MGKKKALPSLKLASLKEVDQALQEMADLERQEADIKNRMNKRIDEIKAAADEDQQQVAARKKELDEALKSYLLLHQADLFSEKKTRELTFGTLTCRQSTGLTLKAVRST